MVATTKPMLMDVASAEIIGRGETCVSKSTATNVQIPVERDWRMQRKGRRNCWKRIFGNLVVSLLL